MDKNTTLEQVMMLAREIDERLDALEKLTEKERQGLYEPVLFTIPVDGWGTDSTVPEFPLFCDITAEAVTEKDVVAVDVAPGSAGVARSANFTTTQAFDGGFRLRAKQVPKKPIAAQWHILNTAVYPADKEV